jgi:hypothetical protein
MVAVSGFRKSATTAAELASNFKYLSDLKLKKILPAAGENATDLGKVLAKQQEGLASSLTKNPRLAEAFAKQADNMEFEQLTNLKKALGDDAFLKVTESNPFLAKKLAAGNKGDDIVAEVADQAAAGADAAEDIATNAKFANMSDEALKIEATKYMDESGLEAFKKLPSEAQAKLTTADPGLRWKAGNQPAGYEWIKGACKNYPKMCIIGATGGLVGGGFATAAVLQKVKEEFQGKGEEIQACIATCLPNDYYDSKVSGYGSKAYKDLTFVTLEELKKSTGNNDITAQNTPLCTKAMDPPEKCPQMCSTRCEAMHQTFLQQMARTAGATAGAAAAGAAGAAGEGLAGFLDAFFGDGMGIPSAIGIFITIIILMVLVSTM